MVKVRVDYMRGPRFKSESVNCAYQLKNSRQVVKKKLFLKVQYFIFMSKSICEETSFNINLYVSAYAKIPVLKRFKPPINVP